MPAFRLLTQRPLLVVSQDPGLSQRLKREGYDLIATSPLEPASWLRFCLGLLRTRTRYHWVVESPLNAADEQSLRTVLRFFPFLIQSWTRYEEAQELLFQQRLVQLAERDFNVKSQQGRPHDLESQQRTTAKPASEFDEVLASSHP